MQKFQNLKKGNTYMENWIVIFYSNEETAHTQNSIVHVVKNCEFRDAVGWCTQESSNSKGEYSGKKFHILPISALKAPENQISGIEVSYKAI